MARPIIYRRLLGTDEVLECHKRKCNQLRHGHELTPRAAGPKQGDDTQKGEKGSPHLYPHFSLLLQTPRVRIPLCWTPE